MEGGSRGEEEGRGANKRISMATLENLEYFVKQIIPVMKSASASNLSPQEVQRAWKWATYCHMVQVELSNEQHFLSAVDFIVKQMPVMDRCEVQNILREPKTALNEAAFQNPFLGFQEFKELIQLNLKESSQETLIKTMEKICISKSVAEHLSTSFSSSLDQPNASSSSETKRLYLNLWTAFMKATFRSEPPHFRSSSLPLLDSILKKAFQSDEALSLIVEVVLRLTTTTLANEEDDAKRLVAAFLPFCDLQPSRFRLLNQDPRKLLLLSEKSEDFRRKYLLLLEEEGQLLVERFTSGSISGEGFWENSAGHLSFPSLVNHWSILICQPQDGNSRNEAIGHLTKLAALNSKSQVWPQICTLLNIKNK